MYTIAMLSPSQLGIVLVIVLILFGAGKLPQVFGALGKGLKSFKDAQKDDVLDVTTASSSEEPTKLSEGTTEETVIEEANESMKIVDVE